MDWIKSLDLSQGIKLAFFNLILVGLIGCFLRYILVFPAFEVNYTYVLHAHSHLAFLGWVFMALYVLMVYAFLPAEVFRRGKYLYVFFLMQVANFGMLFTFPFTGYAFWSILFSTLHAVTAMIFAWIFIRDVQSSSQGRNQMTFQMIKWSLILMVVSNLAPFALGPVSAIYGKTDLYYLLIYFYLHFQYNGWFTFALLGLMLWTLETYGVRTNIKLVRVGFLLKLIAVFPAYILSTLWTKPDLIWYILGGLSAVAQLAGFLCIAYFLIRNRKAFGMQRYPILHVLFWVGMAALLLQHVLMLQSVIPDLAALAFARNIVIAYLHLVLLGFVSVWIFFLAVKHKLVQLNSVSKTGFYVFLLSFLVVEIVLLFQGQLDHSPQLLFYLSLGQLVGILGIASSINQIKQLN